MLEEVVSEVIEITVQVPVITAMTVVVKLANPADWQIRPYRSKDRRGCIRDI